RSSGALLLICRPCAGPSTRTDRSGGRDLIGALACIPSVLSAVPAGGAPEPSRTGATSMTADIDPLGEVIVGGDTHADQHTAGVTSWGRWPAAHGARPPCRLQVLPNLREQEPRPGQQTPPRSAR